MKIYYDFHIHTALSPCGNEDMNPSNIINMSLLKGLDAIAITDHNSILNCLPCIEAAENKDIIVIPGVEIQSKEEVHLLCLFKSLESAEVFYKEIIENDLKEINKVDFFGNQYIFDKNSKIVGEEEKLLITSINMTIKQINLKVKDLDGVVIPAHIDKKNYSIISNLGFIPLDLDVKTIEISNKCDVHELINKNEYLSKYRIIKNSDAHYLGDISEGLNYIEVEEKSIDSIIDKLKFN